MTRTIEMFEKPRKAREFLMHTTDAYCCNSDGSLLVDMTCRRCGYESGWTIVLPNMTAAKRGLPCPKCNNHKEGGL